ncbi:uncharacterized protein LOC110737033 isoform X2 [Chenopodium quinoa]|uniref:uncharacterized protein LOC110737033 isoform X2 n=1 Tax=Chenopodium quinoa TaxID=63459 RepID=UPI000B771E42|nr:uncharacterized protein LOC110737033 isoform X2 [Chenopodium quinoa]XP_021773077.1 uncharacterized protein LOC110737033 isoform X2 [Chenopodium quinoa]
MALRVLGTIRYNSSLFFSHLHCHQTPSQYRSIFATSHLDISWMDSIKGVFTGKKPTSDSVSTEEKFTLYSFADELGKARKLGSLKQYVVGRSSEATFADAFAKQEAILRYLAYFDPNGENLQISQKQEAAKQCKCTIADVENTLAKYTWAKEAQYKLQKLKEEGKPMPKTMAEVQKLMGSTPLDRAKSNMAQTGQISRNAFCPCGSKKRYKRISDQRYRSRQSYTRHDKSIPEVI